MLSKIRVEFDFDNNEPYLQLRLEGYDQDGGELADKTLKHFIEKSIEKGGMVVTFNGAGNGLPQIRPGIRPEIGKDYGSEIKRGKDLLGYALVLLEEQGISNNTVSAIKNFLNNKSSSESYISNS